MAILVLSVDPGSSRTGYCWKLRQNSEVWPTINRGIIRPPELLKWLTAEWDRWLVLPHSKFIVLCEDFVQRPGLESKWIKQPTAKIFGAVRLMAHVKGATFIPTRPDTLKTGTKLAGIKWSGQSHLRDDLSAEAHAAYFCVHGYDPKRVRDWLD